MVSQYWKIRIFKDSGLCESSKIRGPKIRIFEILVFRNSIVIIFEFHVIAEEAYQLKSQGMGNHTMGNTMGSHLRSRNDLNNFTIPKSQTDRWSSLFRDVQSLSTSLGVVDFCVTQSSLEETFLRLSLENEHEDSIFCTTGR
ncbi:hypothetical protein Y032_0003g1582 [Ancylostoma ceylanicum]|uniref:Uncharacterized protein n=1 Tax=Ancylostoma ceylanicum TaxID=53326 RepID=A0A016VYG7_9BILA|nr:hypothetical protein Y032_0003g1582 [Ancylostoma ceylanicum]